MVLITLGSSATCRIKHVLDLNLLCIFFDGGLHVILMAGNFTVGLHYGCLFVQVVVELSTADLYDEPQYCTLRHHDDSAAGREGGREVGHVDIIG